MSWSKIRYTQLASVIRNNIYDNTEENQLVYHTMNHINAMYEYLQQSNEPYDEILDWAVLAHDLVYDNLPNKEQRSAELFLQYAKQFSGCTLGDYGKQRVVNLIMATVDHVVTTPDTSAIIRADLAALANPVQTLRNYLLIMEESKNLYGSSGQEVFAENTIVFMRKLRNAVNQNWLNDPIHADFYLKIKRGINQTINISKAIQGYDCGEI
jgi:hypothetical protein